MQLLSVFLFIFALFLTPSHPQAETLSDVPVLKSTDATIINNAGETIGSVEVTKGTEGVILNISVQGLPDGRHGMHFHEVGDCSDFANGFKKAGGHIMPENKPHGFVNPKGPHAGNLPNLVVHQSGWAKVELYSNMVTYDEGPAALVDGDGSALIIHTNPDDHFSQPIGGAGGRIGCAVIK